MTKRTIRVASLATAAALSLAAALPAAAQSRELVNVSYDPTRELYRAYGEIFAAQWRDEHGETLNITNSHGGSGAQVNAVLDGLPADLVTFPLAGDVLAIERGGLIEPGWEAEFPEGSSPYTSTIVFVVRAGNPHGIEDWDDLIQDGVQVITPNPKTSGGARWNYLAAWAYELERTGGDAQAAQDFVAELYRHVPVLDSGARGSTNTFVQNGVGDVFISWENEAFLILNELGEGQYEIVVPSISILAEIKVAIVDVNADSKGTRDIAQAYLEGLYTPEAQQLIAANYYRPRYPEFANAEDVARFPEVRLITIDDVFGGWVEAQATHFDDGGIFDQIYSPF
ncbi:MAG: sulfate ABC transporter substrate-binding protein [Bauldia sp.]|nr:sulfate ABC transporter substrate-binding protein [Bauldia sp.]